MRSGRRRCRERSENEEWRIKNGELKAPRFRSMECEENPLLRHSEFDIHNSPFAILPMCGIFGIDGCDDASNLTYLGLYALQHRGQESAGIVSWDGTQLHLERGMGHVSDIFKEKVIARLPGRRALGHTRYSTAGSSVVADAQPIVLKTPMGPVGPVHHANSVNPT